MARQAELPPDNASIVVGAVRLPVGRRRRGSPSATPARRASARCGSTRCTSGRGSPALGYVDAGRTAGRPRRAPRVHARRAAARRRAPLRRVVGLPGDRLLRADGALRNAGRPPSLRRRAAPAGHRRDRRLGAGALPQGRLEPCPLRRHGAVRARRSPPRASTPTGGRSCSTTAATRCATSSSPTRSTGSRSSTSTGSASMPWHRCSTSTTRARPGAWIPNRLGGRENLDAIEFLRQLNAVVFGRFPGVLMIAGRVDGLAAGDASGPSRRSRVLAQVEHGVDARHPRVHVDRSGAPPLAPPRAHLRSAVRVQRAVRAAAQPRRGRPRQGLPAGQDVGRRVAALRQPAGHVRLDVGATPGHRCCSWAARWRPGRSGTPTPVCRGTCSTMRRTAASSTSSPGSTRWPRRGRRCGSATSNRRGSSGSTPTMPTSPCSRSSGGAASGARPWCAWPT